jgi:hypothetical protein
MITGCAKNGLSTYSYSKPNSYEFSNEIIVDTNFEKVWDGMVAELAKTFFTINNIDKASRIINVSFYSQDADKYIDCGQSHRKTTRGDITRAYDYPVAGDNSYTLEGPGAEFIEWSLQIHRDVKIEGKINIYLAPISNDKTKVSTNVRFIRKIYVSGENIATHINGGIVSRVPIKDKNFVDSFSTNEIYRKKELDGTEIICLSKGVLENMILDIARNL